MKLRCALVGVAGLAVLGGVARADVAQDIADLAARVDYGFYANEGAVLAGARDALAELSGHEPLLDYYRAYAAWRLAMLEGPGSRRAPAALEDCIELAEAAADDANIEAEAWILVAGCSALAAEASPLLGVMHQRRRTLALERARAAAPENPRLLLVAALHALPERPPADPALRDELTAALAAFEAWPNPFDLPDWGEPETLAALGAHELAAGDPRAARDYIERALLVAPDYAYALSLQRQLQGR